METLDNLLTKINEPNVQKFLANASAGDTHHDFGKIPSILGMMRGNIKPYYCKGLPNNETYEDDKINDEDYIIHGVIRTPPDYRPIVDYEKKGPKYTFNFPTVESPEQVTTISNITYTVKRTQVKELKNVIGNKKTWSDYISAKKFTSELGIENKSAFVIDATAIGLKEILTTNDTSSSEPQKTIYFIKASELENDPAGKTTIDDPIFKKSEGHNLVSCISSGYEDYYWYSWDPKTNPENQIDAYKLFFTKYKLKLSNLRQVLKGKSLSFNTSLQLIDEESKLFTKPILDSGNANSINSLKSVINSVFKFFNSSASKKDVNKTNLNTFTMNTSFQQKRSGDWLQVLLCLLVYQRKFKTVRNGTNNSEINDIQNQFSDIYFVTHDRIALAFALLIGVNVLFTHGDTQSVYAFKIENIEQKNQRINNQFASINEESIITDLNNRLQKIKDYADSYKTTIYDAYIPNDYIKDNCNTLNTYINNKKFTGTDIENYIQNIFKLSYQHCYFKVIFPNIQDIISKINEFNITSFQGKIANTGEDIEKRISVISEYNEILSKIQNVENIIGQYISEPNSDPKGDYSAVIKFDFGKLLEKFRKDPLYKFASDWTWDINISTRFFDRLIGISNYKNDKNIFLYNLNNLDDDLKKTIVEVFANFYKLLNDNTNLEIMDKNISSNQPKPPKPVNYIKFKNIMQSFCVEVLLNLGSVLDGVAISEYPDIITEFLKKPIDYANIPSIAEINIIEENNKIIEKPDEFISTVNAYEETTITTGGADITLLATGSQDMNMVVEEYPTLAIKPLLSMHISYNTINLVSNKDLLEQVKDIYNKLQNNVENIPRSSRGGAKEDILTNNSICFHPSLPIYMMANSYLSLLENDNIDETLEYEFCIEYLIFLMKCQEKLVSYANDNNTVDNKIKAYIIGMGLKELFFTANVDDEGYQKCYESLGMTSSEYLPISSLSSTLSYMSSGRIIQTDEEKLIGYNILSSPIFSEYIRGIDAKDIFSNYLSEENEKYLDINALYEESKQFLLDTGRKIISDRTGIEEPILEEPIIEEPIIEEPIIEEPILEEPYKKLDRAKGIRNDFTFPMQNDIEFTKFNPAAAAGGGNKTKHKKYNTKKRISKKNKNKNKNNTRKNKKIIKKRYSRKKKI